MHGAPGRVGRHRAGHDGEWLFRVTPLLTRRGNQVASGITGVDGLSKTGRLLGAQAAAWVWGGAVVKGGASGV